MILKILVSLILWCSANELTAQTPSERIYVSANHMAVQGNQLLVALCGEWLPVRAIHSDERGLYVSPNDFWNPLVWICRNQNCKAENFFMEEFCSNCGWSRFG